MPSPDPALLSSLYGQLNWKALLLEKRHPRPKALNIFFTPLCVRALVHTLGCAHPGLCTPTWIGGGGSSIRGFLRSCWFSSLLYQGKKKGILPTWPAVVFPNQFLLT